jgi:hypothetical protein
VSKRSREKGMRWQSDLALRWRERRLFSEARSTQGEQGPTLDGAKRSPVPDVEGTPYWCEAKHTRACNPIAALRQAIREAEEAGDDRAPIAVCKPSGDKLCGPVVAMRLADWEALVRLVQYGAARLAEDTTLEEPTVFSQTLEVVK